jgi:hypothetical protein
MAFFSAGLLSNIALGAQVAGAIGSTYAAYRESQGQKRGYEYQSQVARNNAQLAEWQAQDALERGQSDKQRIQLKKASIIGTQEAVLASRNVALDEGSALRILADTELMAERDIATVEENAAKEAWALRNQAAGYQSNAGFLQSRAGAQSPLLDAAATALTTGGRVAGSWYAMRTRTTASPYTV